MLIHKMLFTVLMFLAINAQAQREIETAWKPYKKGCDVYSESKKALQAENEYDKQGYKGANSFLDAAVNIYCNPPYKFVPIPKQTPRPQSNRVNRLTRNSNYSREKDKDYSKSDREPYREPVSNGKAQVAY